MKAAKKQVLRMVDGDPSYELLGLYKCSHPAGMTEELEPSNMIIHDYRPGAIVEFIEIRAARATGRRRARCQRTDTMGVHGGWVSIVAADGRVLFEMLGTGDVEAIAEGTALKGQQANDDEGADNTDLMDNVSAWGDQQAGDGRDGDGSAVAREGEPAARFEDSIDFSICAQSADEAEALIPRIGRQVRVPAAPRPVGASQLLKGWDTLPLPCRNKK